MSTYTLFIRLLTPLGAGTGVGRSGSVDREVPLGRFGIPHLPGKRVKGLWRDGLVQVLDAIGGDRAWADHLFGETGDSTGSRLRVRTGVLRQAAGL